MTERTNEELADTGSMDMREMTDVSLGHALSEIKRGYTYRSDEIIAEAARRLREQGEARKEPHEVRMPPATESRGERIEEDLAFFLTDYFMPVYGDFKAGAEKTTEEATIELAGEQALDLWRHDHPPDVEQAPESEEVWAEKQKASARAWEQAPEPRWIDCEVCNGTGENINGPCVYCDGGRHLSSQQPDIELALERLDEVRRLLGEPVDEDGIHPAQEELEHAVAALIVGVEQAEPVAWQWRAGSEDKWQSNPPIGVEGEVRPLFTHPLHEPQEGWRFDDGSRWELGDSMAGGSHPASKTVNDQMVPGFITLRIISADGDEQEHRYNLCAHEPQATVTDEGARNAHRSGYSSAIGMFAEVPVDEAHEAAEEALAWDALVADDNCGPQWTEHDEQVMPVEDSGQ